MRIKKLTAVLLSAVMAVGMLAGCGGSKDGGSDSGKEETGSVYYLNFKPEVAETWEKIAKDYTEETGVEVKVQTAAAGTYEQTLKSEIAKKDAPTLFQINGPIGLKSWKDYCADLSDTELYGQLLDQSMAVSDEDGVFGIPYVEEGYGIIYNNAIMEKYFALPDKAVDISSTEEIKNFDTLKAVVEDMQAKKADLGIDGVFASTSLKTGEDWRWQTHLANLPIYYEYKDDNVQDKEAVDFKYADNFKNIFDLYLNNSCTEPAKLGSKSVEDSMSEFALGKVAMVQNGNWGWGQVSGVDGNVVKEEDVKFLPIYTGVAGEENQGLCIGTENYFSINSQASEADQKASIDFITWLFNSDKGKAYITNDLGFIAPFSSFTEEEQPSDPLAKEVIRYMSDENLTNVSWNFVSFPSQNFKDMFGADLLSYAQGKMDWNTVKDNMVKNWAEEKAAIAE